MNSCKKVLFIANSTEKGAYGIRARGLQGYFKSCDSIIVYRKNRFFSIFNFIYTAITYNPSVIYVVNIAFAGVAAALFLKVVFKKQLIVDLGDINYYIFKEGGKNKLSCLIIKMIEDIALAQTNIIVTRTNKIKEYLIEKRYKKKIYYIPDGVDAEQFKPKDSSSMKASIAKDGEIIVGVLGSINWVKKTQWCYGMELVEALNILKHKRIRGLIVGDGSGLTFLKHKARACGILEKITFTGFLPYEELQDYINIMDICLSTQTNDIVGTMRLAGKIPLYLSCGKHILASDVGEVRHILPDNMRLSYNGSYDPDYPKHLAAALEDILGNRDILKKAASLRNLALEKFDYKILSEQVENIIISMVGNA